MWTVWRKKGIYFDEPFCLEGNIAENEIEFGRIHKENITINIANYFVVSSVNFFFLIKKLIYIFTIFIEVNENFGNLIY